MKKSFFNLFFFLIPFSIKAQEMIPFEKDNNYSANYYETIDYFRTLSEKHDILQFESVGHTDSGYPLHELVVSKNGVFERDTEKNILFINNAIHPGEPCGVDATMMLVRNICENNELQKLLDYTQIVIVPFYNIGGALNRNSSSRANQLGPAEYGFRGNAKNLDLNRDFIKCDSKNARSFNLLFNKWKPHVMIDNHTSNGADYQYVMTLIATQKDKLEKQLSEFMTNKMLPQLYTEMKDRNYEMIPYVYSFSTPDDGIYGFLDLPRYSSGYAALHNTISFMPETHMLKPYKDRVLSTYEFMLSMLVFLNESKYKLPELKKEATRNQRKSNQVNINWTLDKEAKEELSFKGYEAKQIRSELTGMNRLFYDRNKPYEKKVSFYNTYKASETITIPEAYLIPQAYDEVIDRLKWNGVDIEVLNDDIELEVEYSYILDYDTTKEPYEGHYLHSAITLENKIMKQNFYKGDYIIKTDQEAINYIISVLEPHAPDSFFAWNFFDGILMQKEYFSDYVFEDLALDILKKKPKLKASFEQLKKEDEEFASNARLQLEYIYKNSAYYEKTHRRYPVARILKNQNDK